MLFKMLMVESVWHQYSGDVGAKPRQLFLTRSQHLADKVEESFSRLYRTHVLEKRNSAAAADADISVDFGDRPVWNARRPDAFSGLTNEHFPLFLSFDAVSSTYL